MKAAREKRLLQLNELEEFRMQSYENSRMYKDRMNQWCEKKTLNRSFEPGLSILLFNSRLKLFLGELRSKRSGPFIVVKAFPYGAVEIMDSSANRKFSERSEIEALPWRRVLKAKALLVRTRVKKSGKVRLKTINLTLLGRQPKCLNPSHLYFLFSIVSFFCVGVLCFSC